MPLCHPDSRPDVSVIIPVFNKLELTRVCLESIHLRGAQASFEIIVVDNGSTDGTREYLQGMAAAGRLKAILNGENLGFARGCNLGAAAAGGRYLLFLNNDMEVRSGWLDPLVSTLEKDPRVGIVGGRLLYPDDTIQHAGVAIYRIEKEGRHALAGMHLNHHLPADTPGARKPLALQAVTGACLLMRAELFGDLEGFDAGYYNGNEDVDLCLRAGEMGWRVVYRPESVITHFESQSGPERWARVGDNVRRFQEIWQDRAVPDLAGPGENALRPTAEIKVQAYAEPRLRRALDPAAAGDAVSVVVLTWNALAYTRRCLTSLLEHTDPRHELIVVDNGSRPDTVAYLKEMQENEPRLRVIFNERNLGFAAGNNVGIAAATRPHVCLLNSDTVVTAGWLERLLGHLANQPQAGLVGPLTNSITGPQQLDQVDYDQETCTGLEQFAAGLQDRLAGQSQTNLWVVGFCVLIRDQVLAALGGLDESFGQGNYEDTDYCLRAFVAGWRSLIAADSFVHHFGSRSFQEGRVDYAALMKDKQQVFRLKWNLPDDFHETHRVEPTELLARGFLPALDFHPLPDGSHHALWDWEKASWTATGEALFTAGRLEEARRVFAQVVALSPGFHRAANNLACALWQMERPAEAIGILEKVLAEDPGNTDARWNLEQMAPELEKAVR